MQSNNPVFQRAEGFNGQASSQGTTYPGNGQSYAGYGSPSTWSTGAPGDPYTAPSGSAPGYAPAPTTDRMTIDTVVQKTAVTLGVVVLAAAATWLLTGNPRDADVTTANSALSQLYVLSLVGALGAFVLSIVNSFKRVVSPGLVLAFAALEGLFVGAFSKAMEATFGDGLVMGAVVGTFAATAGTLAAYKFFNIRVGNRFRTWVIAAMFGFVGLSVLDLVLGMFSRSFGFNGFGTMGLVASVVGLAIGVLMLILDFDFVERGVAAGLPERESWRAAFGLTVTIVWIYIQLLRLLAILRGND